MKLGKWWGSASGGGGTSGVVRTTGVSKVSEETYGPDFCMVDHTAGILVGLASLLSSGVGASAD